MTDRGPMALVLGLGFLTTLSLAGAARADEVTLNVPVQLTNIAANVTRGRVECQVVVEYAGSQAQAQGAARRHRNTYKGASAEFGFDANGAYNGTATVRVQVEPPREMVEAMVPITIGGSPEYACHIQVAMPGGVFYPERARDMATGQASGRTQGPEWSQPRGGNPEVTGRLSVMPAVSATRPAAREATPPPR